MVLKLDRISYTYPGTVGVDALCDVSLDIEAGQLVSLAGASGSGKTTMLNILGLLQNPTRGEVYFLGERVSSLSSDRASEVRNASIGFVFQHHLLLPELDARENVALNGVISGKLTWKAAMDRAVQLLDVLGLSSRLDHYPRQLSGGEQQRVAIARALINNPAIILADEPTGNLDSANSRKIFKIFRTLSQKMNQTLLIATHNPEIAAACPRRIVMEDGKVLSDVKDEGKDLPEPAAQGA